MLVIVSDIHMTDRLLGDPVSDDELVDWLEGIAAAVAREGEKTADLQLAFLGDIVDLLRSSVWDASTAKPWTGLNPGFTNFAQCPQEALATQAAIGTVARYPAFFARLAKLRADGADVTYVPGNHDFMLRCSPGALQAIRKAFGLSLAGGQFPASLDLHEYELWAEHGERFDPPNLHVPANGAWALGDAIVLFLVNRLAKNVADALKIDERHGLIIELSELDNVEPSYLTPAFIDRAIRRHLANDVEQKKAREAARASAKELLDEPYFKGKAYKSLKPYRKVVELFLNLELDEMARLLDVLWRKSDNLAAAAYQQHSRHKLRHVVFGHTHHATVQPLATYEPTALTPRQAFYINTGTWRRVHVPTWHRRDGFDSFCSTRTVSWVEFTRKKGCIAFRHRLERVGRFPKPK